MKPLTLCALLIAFALPGVSAVAMTPDGMTPAAEDVCDELIGATPGLYGLCVAYCEAQDCDAEAAHSGQCTRTPPSEPVLRNYNRKMQPGDPSMPCLAPPTSPGVPAACPCWTEEEIANIQVTSCNFGEDNVVLAEGSYGEMASININERYCMLESTSGIDNRHSPLDDEQLEACFNLLEQSAISSGTSCLN